ncbi:MAG: nitroreductase [Ruminococcaceae bacterium]|nr:nitroreductase [Oscillospiraceae bacterium]
MDFLGLAHERYSCRRFSDASVEQAKVDKIIEAAIASPTAVNYQPYKIWIIQKPGDLEKVAQTTQHTFHAPMIFAVGGRPEEAWVRKYDSKNFVDIDTAIVATHMMLEIQDLGLGTTWVGSFDEEKLKDLFPSMKGYNIVALFPTGYPAENAHPSRLHTIRKEKEQVVEVL